MNKGIVLVIVLALSIFLSGCGEQVSSGTTFIGGTEGLKVTFMEGNPPDKIIDGGTNEFAVLLKLENVGESGIKVNEGYAQMWGMDAGAYGVNVKYPDDFKIRFGEGNGFDPELRGARKNSDGSVLGGGVTTIDFTGLKYMGTIPGESPQKVWVNMCYKYNTKMATQICAKGTTEQALNNKDICEVEGEKNPQNSGAPIQVTSLRETYIGNGKISLVLTLTHVGSGDNFFKDNALNCRDVESNTDKGKVWLGFKKVMIGGTEQDVTCSTWEEPSSRTYAEGAEKSKTYYGGYVRMYKDGSGKETTTVYCTIETPSSTVVEVPVEAVLGYVYLQHVEKDITIRHVTQ